MDVKKENNIYGVLYLEKENVDQMTIGQRIKYFRKRKGYTQKEIGELLGFANTSAGTRIAQYETGIRVPKRNMLSTMAQLFEVSSFALMPLDIDSTNGLMHTLFALEDRYGLTVAEEKGKISLVLQEPNLGLYATLEQALFDWLQQKIKCDSGVITKDEYDEWRYNYPKE